MDTAKKYEIPVGICSWDDLKKGDFFAEMEDFYTQYQPKKEVVARIATLLRFINDPQNAATKQFDAITVYFGAWCGDSKEHLPAFIKICEMLQNEEQLILPYTLVACNRTKEHGLPAQEFDFKIELVPTFVFQYWDNGEKQTLGTIVETPQATIEEDMETILHQLMK
jgi:thiol-disulfide isomerase/thioredoxin